MIGCGVDWALTFQGLKTILDPLAAASWPIAAGVTFYGFRDSIQKLIPRIRSFKGIGVEAEVAVEEQQTAATEALASLPLAPIGTEMPPLHVVYSAMDAETNAILDEVIGQAPEKRMAWAIRMRSISETNRRHEQWYRLMFGSQLRALQRLGKVTRAPTETFRPFYVEAVEDKETAALHEGRTFEQWGQFLIDIGYVATVPGTQDVEITPTGMNFLIWMVEAKVHEWRPG